MRKGAWGQVAKVSRIECVGEVVEDTTARLAQGILGRVPRNGSVDLKTLLMPSSVWKLNVDGGMSQL